MTTKPAHALVDSVSPATGERLGAVPAAGTAEVEAIVVDAARVQPFWAQLPLGDRARYMRRTAQVVIDALDELSELIAREQGKPRTEAYALELLPSIDALHWIAREGERILRDERIRQPHPLLIPKRSLIAYEPVGVVAVISPSSYPWLIPLLDAAIALMCGNTVVLKPSARTPLTGERIGAVFARAGMPGEVVQIVHGDADAGRALVAAPVDKVLYNGGAAGGHEIAARCAERRRGAVLTLEGNDPQIVLDDADIDRAAAGCAWSAFANAGQTRSRIQRVYVVRDAAPRFTTALVDLARRLRVGDPLEWDTEVGPLISTERFDAARALVDEALAAGAQRHCGGPVDVPGLSGRFLAPSVLSDVPPDARLMREPVLGPVVTVTAVDGEEQAVRLANDSQLGLGASVWTLDRGKGTRIARRLEAGSVWINDHMYSFGACQCPWGGVKGSGLGRTHSKFGFYECVHVKHIAWDPARMPNLWWPPYDRALATALHATAQLMYGRDADKRGALARGAPAMLKVAQRTLRAALGVSRAA